MTSAWIALCDEDERKDLRRALGAHDPSATLSFAGDAQELRQWAQESNRELGVMVGPLAGSISSINVAAAIVRDESATCVALATHDPAHDLLERAQQAGISQLVDLGVWENDGCELEEPLLQCDEVPTMLFLPREPDADALRSVPKVDAQGAPPARRVPPATKQKASPSTKEVVVPSTKETTSPLEEEAAVQEVPKMPAVQSEQDTSDAHNGRAKRIVEEAMQGKAPVVALFSGRGGVGKTAIAATMAHAAASWGLRVALCDMDLPFGNLYSCFGLSGPVSLLDASGEVIEGEQKLLEAGAECSQGLELWGSTVRPEMSELVVPHVERLVNALARNYDLVIVDTSTTFNDAVAQVAQRCDRMLLVCDGRPGSNAAQARLGSLAVRLGVARTRIACVLNRCSARGRGDTAVNRADVGLETARVYRIADGGSEVSSCLAQGNPKELFELGSKFSDSVSHALAQLLAELGCLPDHAEAKRALERKEAHTRWTFGRKREAM